MRVVKDAKMWRRVKGNRKSRKSRKSRKRVRVKERKKVNSDAKCFLVSRMQWRRSKENKKVEISTSP